MGKAGRARAWKRGIETHGPVRWWAALLTFPLWGPVYLLIELMRGKR